MPIAQDIPGVVFKNASAIMLARVVQGNGAPVVPSQVSSVKYAVSVLDIDEPDRESPVAGHNQRSLAAGDVLYATLQRDEGWDMDDIGYNFRHELDTLVDPAFPAAGRYYRIRYDLAMTGGQVAVVRFRVKAI